MAPTIFLCISLSSKAWKFTTSLRPLIEHSTVSHKYSRWFYFIWLLNTKWKLNKTNLQINVRYFFFGWTKFWLKLRNDSKFKRTSISMLLSHFFQVKIQLKLQIFVFFPSFYSKQEQRYSDLKDRNDKTALKDKLMHEPPVNDFHFWKKRTKRTKRRLIWVLKRLPS